MDAGVDDEADGSPHLVGELSEFRVRILVKSELRSQALGIKAPAFDECSVAAVAPKVRNSLQLLGERDLKVMAWHRLVRAQDFHLPNGSGVELVGVDHKLPGAAGRDRSGLVVR